MAGFRFLPFLIAICLLWLASPAFLAAKAEPAGDVTVKEAAELLKKDPGEILILDVRTPAEFKQGHLPNARNMDFFGGRFDQDVQQLPRDKPILLYCRSGKRSAGAAEILKEAGIKNVIHMRDGMNAWEKAGLPVEKPEKGD